MKNRKNSKFKSPIKTVSGIKVIKAANRTEPTTSNRESPNDSASSSSSKRSTKSAERALAEKWGINDKTSIKMADKAIGDLAKVFFS